MKKLNIPKGTSKNGFYTDGGEFMTEDYNNYVGYFNIQSDGNVYTKPSLKNDSVRLIKYVAIFDRETKKVYDKVKTHQLKKNFNVVGKEFKPEKEDFQRGFAYRYFCKKKKTDYIVEIDKKQYDKLMSGDYSTSMIYKLIKIPWKLKGDMFDVFEGNVRIVNGVFDSNKRVIKNAEKTLFGIENIINSYLEKTVFSDYYKNNFNDNK